MEDLSLETYCGRAALELAALVLHQRRPRGKTRRESALLQRFVSQVLASGLAPQGPPSGPWRVDSRPLRRPGRGGLRFIPLVRRGQTEIMVSTPREAEELVTFLNYCGMEELATR
jgi:hypothetical protein